MKVYNIIARKAKGEIYLNKLPVLHFNAIET